MMTGSKAKMKTEYQRKRTKTKTASHNPLDEHIVHNVCFRNEGTWADHVFNLVDELFGHQVRKAPHAQHPAILLAGDALQTLVLLNLVEHVSDTDGTHINTGITAHMHQHTQVQAMR